VQINPCADASLSLLEQTESHFPYGLFILESIAYLPGRRVGVVSRLQGLAGKILGVHSHLIVRDGATPRVLDFRSAYDCLNRMCGLRLCFGVVWPGCVFCCTYPVQEILRCR
jgi:hypothetical protein